MVVPANHLPLAGRTILLVEDDLDIAEAIVSCLEDVGASVLTATHVHHALAIVERPDLSAAILDFELGNDDTIDVCRRLNERAIPFLIFSGYDDGYVRDRWPSATVVEKPAGEQVLIRALLAALVAGAVAEPASRA
jgi:CheY-like chemotaxis protein